MAALQHNTPNQQSLFLRPEKKEDEQIDICGGFHNGKLSITAFLSLLSLPPSLPPSQSNSVSLTDLLSIPLILTA
jgi:hypothetical protein